MHGHGFDAGTVLGRCIDSCGPGPQVHGAALADRSHLLVRHGAHGQWGQFKDLAGLGNGVFVQFLLAHAAMGCTAVNDGFIDVDTLAQGVAFVARLPAIGPHA